MPTEQTTVLFSREQAKKPIVVVVGCGFGGLQAAMHLHKLDIELVLIDRTNHHLFQPLLYQVSTAALAPSDIASPIRALLGTKPNVSVILGEVDGVDKEEKTVCIKDTGVVPYDYLILATGSAYAWFGHDEWSTHAAVLKTLPDALQIRRRILEAFDWAETRTDPEDVKALMTFVVVGGGPTGVELAGAIAELAHSTLARDFRRIRSKTARIVLCEGGDHLLTGFPARLSDYARRRLQAIGVEVRTGTPVGTIDAEGAIAGGERIAAANVLWCAGTKATGVAAMLGAAQARNGALTVAPDCSVPGHADVFAVGDIAAMATPDGHPLPGVGPVAKQQGAYVAKVIAARVAGRPAPAPFAYEDAGQLAMVGRSAAVADLGRFRVTGFPAWLLWSAVHLFFLIGARNRVLVYLNWAWAWLTYGRGARLITVLDKETHDMLVAGDRPAERRL
jgi:NADH dehydrogenase